MAIAVMIVSTEGGRQTVTTIAASEEEAREAATALETARPRFLGIDSEAATKYTARAWEVIGQHWEESREKP
jgi:hypothetical protein